MYPPTLINGRRREEGHYPPIFGYLDAALGFIASERAWYAVQRDRDVGQGWVAEAGGGAAAAKVV